MSGRPVFAVPLRRSAAALLALVPLAACADSDPTGSRFRDQPADTVNEVVCDLPDSLLASGGVPPNGIPALTDPRIVEPGHGSLQYLNETSRVLGVVVDGEPRAYPHGILWWHEIVNDRVPGTDFAVTYCPLTGSGLVFDRRSMGNRPDLGVSGLLFANNLVMYNRENGNLFGPQMSVEGKCGNFRDVRPTLLPVMETSWGRWQELHPSTTVVSGQTGHDRRYNLYPYGDYDLKTNPLLLHQMNVDRTRPPKERVLGIPAPDGGVGYPFDELAKLGERGVVQDTVDGRAVVVFWDKEIGGTAVAYDGTVDGGELTFEATADGYRDAGTGTLWDLAGRAVEGPLSGSRLEALPAAYVSFWFAWRHFEPDSRTWTR